MTTEIRLINIDGPKPVVKKPFEAFVRVEPCAPASRRYVVKHPAGEVEHPWFQVILAEDDARVRFLKYQAAKNYQGLLRERAVIERKFREEGWEIVRENGWNVQRPIGGAK